MKKINLILDIDDTLINTFSFNFKDNKNIEMENSKKSRIGIINIPNFIGIVYFRPYLIEFLRYCFTFFNVSFWTAGSTLYCREVLKLILTQEQFDKTIIVLARDNNNYVDIKTNIIYQNVTCQHKILKPLELLWNDRNLSKIFTLKNTILVDNNEEIINCNLLNSILIKEFTRLDNNDILLCWLCNLLNLLKETDDVRKLKNCEKKISNCCNGILKYT